MENITFDQLPQAMTLLIAEVGELKRMVLQQGNSQPAADQWFDLDKLVAYDPEKRSKATFYGYVQDNAIPYHKRGKKLTFLKSEIDSWLKSGRKKTAEEIDAAASSHLRNSRTRRASAA